ncbi:MAG: DUF58 domain-containing protein [Planctomycetota bacterium]|nr:DUF58 domain-containing protein [Planctomycetota bacterium]
MDENLDQFQQQAQDNLEMLQMFPWLTLVIFTLPLILVARNKVYPSLVYVVALFMPAIVSISIIFAPNMLLPAIILDLLIFLVAGFDLFTTPSSSCFTAERIHQKVASLAKPAGVKFKITNNGRRTIKITLVDDIPEEFEADVATFSSKIAGKESLQFEYQVTPHQRGNFPMRCVYVRVTSSLRFWKRDLILPVRTELHVYPDLKQLSHYALLARTNRLALLGVRRTRKVGQDNEFERLREYTRDDHYKNINWRSSARHNKLIVKDYQTSQSQRIIFMVDCGRMMTNESNGMSFVDHALNSALMLSHVALSQGDSGGLICFSDKVHCFVPPRSNVGHMNQLLHASFNQFPRMVESRYDEAFLYLANRCNKRAMVVLITNVVDEVNSQQVVRYMQTVSKRHLPVSVMMRDYELYQEAEQTESLFNAAAAAQILNWRHDVLNTLSHQGVFSLDVLPEDLTAPLINQYLEIKARHLL